MNRRSRSITRSLKCPRLGTWCGDRLDYRRRVGLPGCAARVIARLRWHHWVLLGLPAGRGLPAGPRIIGRAVKVSALMTVVAVLQAKFRMQCTTVVR
jgi:hypothetical protein